MNITTKFGEFKDLKVEPYGEGTYTLSKIENGDEYIFLGFDAPIPTDEVWRFWVECGDVDGHAKTHSADLTETEMEYIKQMYSEYIK